MSKKAEWAEKINQMKASDLGQKAWCQEQGINYSTMRSWLSKLTEKPIKIEAPSGVSTEWVEALPPESSVKAGTGIQVGLGPFVIEVAEGFNPEVFGEVCQRLKGLC